MSLRTLKKLRGDSELQSQIGADGQSVSESEDGAERGVKPNKRNKKKQLIGNPFTLLDGGGGSPSDTEAKEDDDKEGTSANNQKKDPVETAEIARHIEETKHKNKKKRKSRLNKQRSSEIVLEEDEIDASIREVNKILGVDINSSTSKDQILIQDHSQQQHSKNLLTVAHKHLNPNNEMRKMFGSKVVHAEQGKRRGRHKSHSKATWLVAHRPNWPHIEKLGVSMALDENKGGQQFFKFEHNKQYQNVQFQLQAAIASFNPENIAALLQINPYHIDSLIQLSDACKMGEDIQVAGELIERALYGLESSFHTLFNITLGTCRLDYRRPENRSFFIALFKHIHFIGTRGCHRTALEFSKLLLSLDPDDDPLCILLIIDFYAIKSEQYEFIVKLFDEWEAVKNLSKLPNFAFSVALAKFHQSFESGMESKRVEADNMLQNSLMMFPSVLLPLLDKCGVQPDSQVSSSDFFSKSSRESEPPALKLLMSMYIEACSPLWKEPDVLGWLEFNVKETLKKLDSNQNIITEYKKKRLNIYKAKLPVNICRYAILKEVKENIKAIPDEILQNPGPGYDPVPPTDSITSYTRPSRGTQASSGDQNVLSLLFRSMMPTFTAEQHQDRHQDQLLAMLNNQEDDTVAAAAAAAAAGAAGAASPGIGNDLQRSVSSLIDAVRDLLSNLHLPEIPRDGDGDDEDSDDEREE